MSVCIRFFSCLLLFVEIVEYIRLETHFIFQFSIEFTKTMKSICYILVGHHYIHISSHGAIIWRVFYVHFETTTHLIALNLYFFLHSIKMLVFIYISLFKQAEPNQTTKREREKESARKDGFLSSLIGFLLEFDLLLNWFIHHLIHAKVLINKIQANVNDGFMNNKCELSSSISIEHFIGARWNVRAYSFHVICKIYFKTKNKSWTATKNAATTKKKSTAKKDEDLFTSAERASHLNCTNWKTIARTHLFRHHWKKNRFKQIFHYTRCYTVFF